MLRQGLHHALRAGRLGVRCEPQASDKSSMSIPLGLPEPYQDINAKHHQDELCLCLPCAGRAWYVDSAEASLLWH